MKKLLALVLGATLGLSACSIRLTDFTLSSTKNYNLNANKFVSGKRVTGEHTVPVVFIPFGMPDIKTAIDKAIESNTCAVALSDVVVYQVNRSFLIGSMGFAVEGTEVLDTSKPGCTNAK